MREKVFPDLGLMSMNHDACWYWLFSPCSILSLPSGDDSLVSPLAGDFFILNTFFLLDLFNFVLATPPALVAVKQLSLYCRTQGLSPRENAHEAVRPPETARH
jgi:hypothetical protein